jgi:hypothetical protein
MATYKYIYWRNNMPPNEKGERFANVHLLVGYTSESITAFRGMAEEMRKTFPDAHDDKVRCGKVQKSSFAQSFSIIALDTYLPNGEYPGWTQVEEGKMEYYW